MATGITFKIYDSKNREKGFYSMSVKDIDNDSVNQALIKLLKTSTLEKQPPQLMVGDKIEVGLLWDNLSDFIK